MSEPDNSIIEAISRVEAQVREIVADEESDSSLGSPGSVGEGQSSRVRDLSAQMIQLSSTALASMRRAGTRAVLSGKWAAQTAVAYSQRIVLRDAKTLVDQFGLSEPKSIAHRLTRTSSRTTALIGVAAGAAASLEELAPPAWVVLPAEVLVETLVVAAIEMKMVGEIHSAYGIDFSDSITQRGFLVARAWAEARGIDPRSLASSSVNSNDEDPWNRAARREVTRLMQRRMVRRTARNSGVLIPLMAGAAVGGTLNWRATSTLGRQISSDLEHLLLPPGAHRPSSLYLPDGQPLKLQL